MKGKGKKLTMRICHNHWVSMSRKVEQEGFEHKSAEHF